MNNQSVRQGLEEGEKTRELPFPSSEDMVHKKKGKDPDLPMRLTKREDLRGKASNHPDLHPI
jgi:hypothetical protein